MPKQAQNVYETKFPVGEAVNLDPNAFDDLVHSQGVTLIHYIASRCPVGVVDQYDIRNPHEDHEGCSNGFVYKKVGEITCLFTNNTLQAKFQDPGIMDYSLVQVTLPRFYDNSSKQVVIAPFDRLFLANSDITVINWQLKEWHASGSDRLNYIPTEVELLMDSHGVEYKQDFDFKISNGLIVWLPNGKKPGVDLQTGKGIVYSVRYKYQPFFYVRNLLHEIRVTQVEDPITGERRAIQMPRAIVLQREYSFKSENNDPEAPNPNSLRQAMVPTSGGFGPR